MLICSYLNEYFDIVGESWELPQKLATFNELRFIINHVGKSACMSSVFRDGLNIFTHYKQTYFICTHFYFSIKDEMFTLRIKCHSGGYITSRTVKK